MGLFLVLPEIPVRSIAVMNDLPAMSMALVSLLSATHYRRSRCRWNIIVSALAYTLAVLIHPLMFYMGVPILFILFHSLKAHRRMQFWQFVPVLGFWGLIVLLVVAGVLLQVNLAGFLKWVLGYNLNSELVDSLSENWGEIFKYFQSHLALLISAGAGSCVLVCLRRQRRLALGLILVWFYLTMMMLSFLRPLWGHYTFFFSYPLVLLLSGGVLSSIHWLFRKPHLMKPWWQWGVVGLLGIGLICFGIEGTSNRVQWKIWTGDDLEQRHFLKTVCETEDFVISDRQFLTFASGCLVPPNLADTSRKRIATGLLLESEIVNTLMRYPVRFVSISGRLYIEEFNFQQGEASLATAKRCFGPSCIYQFDRDVFYPTHASDAVIADALRLRGYSIEGELKPGEPISTLLFWESLSAISEDWKVFMHLLNDSGEMVAQHDGTPFLGGCPTSTWKPGYQIIDPHPFTLDPALEPGEYQLVVGMYREPALDRLPAVSSGHRWMNDAIILGSIEVVP